MCCLSRFITLITCDVLPDPLFTPYSSLPPLALVRRSSLHHPKNSVLHNPRGRPFPGTARPIGDSCEGLCTDPAKYDAVMHMNSFCKSRGVLAFLLLELSHVASGAAPSATSVWSRLICRSIVSSILSFLAHIFCSLELRASPVPSGFLIGPACPHAGVCNSVTAHASCTCCLPLPLGRAQ